MEPNNQFKTNQEIVWCKGCGNFGILVALQNAFKELKLNPDQILAFYGIGCHGHMANYLKINNFEGLHGRALPLATGAKLANKNLTVLAVAGDGDQLGEGGNHLIHAAKHNIDITCVLHNNQIYSLTVGQASPTSEKGFKTKSTPDGVFDQPINPVAISIAAGASFVARSFAGDVPHLTQTLIKAIQHPGFALVDILQPCVTLNYLNSFTWFKERIYKLEETGYQPDNKVKAFEKAQEWGEKIPLGIFYREERLTLEDALLPQIKKSLAEMSLETKINGLLSEFS
jgi:2-oxoglutarate ferredoxin oxidoreductase subunit beta